MKIVYCITCFSLISACLMAETALHQAEERYAANLYREAIPYYEKASDLSREAYIHYGDALLQIGEYRAAASLLAPIVLDHEPIDQKAPEVYYLARAYRHIGRADSAADLLTQLLDSQWRGEPDPDLVRYELALALQTLGKHSIAKGHFSILVATARLPPVRQLAMLNLARTELSLGDAPEAARQLDALKRLLPENDPLQYEVSFLLGQSALSQRNWRGALAFFERALPKRNIEKAAWYPDTQYYLGCCYLKLATDVESLAKAEQAFKELLTIQPNERTYLALGQCLLGKAALLDDPASYAEAEKILADVSRFTSAEGSAQALLLRAQAAPSYQERDNLYRQLTQKMDAKGSDYAKGWYLR